MKSEILDVIRSCWTKETSADPFNWSRKIPSYGQCVATALLIHDLYGGILYKCNVIDKQNIVPHYFVVLAGERIDPTFDQFVEAEEMKHSIQQQSKKRLETIVFPDFKSGKQKFEIMKKKYQQLSLRQTNAAANVI